ncbi:DUF2061 domain-containing protein [Algoriphagus halophytocola]|uniref:DUF2061 domain-containing protein n=1 Tax=Algoriphagus halophytocola TaxID=2991499 RepID=A0ABY6MD91_9BACT|nr:MULTISPECIES: DUF2061 domain-containing protein [unclassified Algoriphagus]UZD21088.1 DUF2061 domain-containing protein [Algoriphagus sp. TR-M5]WBL42254.1 DUF2061 domain-containing protein [Algoriphagus sp. TR-M9]
MILDQPLKKLFASKPGKDSNTKSLLKSISWRIVGTIDTMIISYFVTGELVMAISIGSVEVFSKIILFYFHERIWESVPKVKEDDTRKEYA